MAGKIEVQEGSILGVMPAFVQLSNNDIAAVLSYLAGLPPRQATPGAIGAKEVAAVRAAPALSAGEVHALRKELARSGLVP
jgi:hypothetical protein